MLEVRCSGTPFQIGYEHGRIAKEKVHGSLAFYRGLFQSTCSMDWLDVTAEAAKYTHELEKTCPQYLEELRGIANGADIEFLDVLALNIRTEIMFGLFTQSPDISIKSDGCTSLACLGKSGESFLSQNWDWQIAQSQNLLICHISQPGTRIPDLSMITEGGIIGKIGFNAKGVGCCLNAIRARGVDSSKLPVHFALRSVLESISKKSAIEKLNLIGVAGSAHILVADPTGSTGLECTSIGIKEIQMDSHGQVLHTNHLVLDHAGVDEPAWLQDSPKRLFRLQHLIENQEFSSPSFSSIFNIFKDEDEYPGAINRCQEGWSETQTLFNIIMNLTLKKAIVSFGRPTAYVERVEISF